MSDGTIRLTEKQLESRYPSIRIIQPSWEPVKMPDYNEMLLRLEKIGRTCYHSENKITDGSAELFIKNIIKRGHLSVLEHETISVEVTVDRGITHEIVRHRIASYTQSSTRYCDYSKEKYEGRVRVVDPSNAFGWVYDDGTISPNFYTWADAMDDAGAYYQELRRNGASPQEARSVLPTSTAAELIMTMNIREWMHFFELRCASGAHPQMREIAGMLLSAFSLKYPLFFNMNNEEPNM